jgi:outer membrane biogenesis lipoprotein LolB
LNLIGGNLMRLGGFMLVLAVSAFLFGCQSNANVPDVDSVNMQPTPVEQNQAKLQQALTY